MSPEAITLAGTLLAGLLVAGAILYNVRVPVLTLRGEQRVLEAKLAQAQNDVGELRRIASRQKFAQDNGLESYEGEDADLKRVEEFKAAAQDRAERGIL